MKGKKAVGRFSQLRLQDLLEGRRCASSSKRELVIKVKLVLLLIHRFNELRKKMLQLRKVEKPQSYKKLCASKKTMMSPVSYILDLRGPAKRRLCNGGKNLTIRCTTSTSSSISFPWCQDRQRAIAFPQLYVPGIWRAVW
jgi:hypothetical protein